MKRCTKCGELRALDEFYRSSKAKDGRESACKQCQREKVSKKDYAPRTEGEKACPRCGRTLPVVRFGKHRRREDGLNSWCRDCVAETSLVHYQKNRDRYLHRFAEYRMENREELLAQQRRWWEDLKHEAFIVYGGLECCWPGCTEKRFECLSLDHIAQDAAERRRQGEPTGRSLYTWLKKEGWPSGFRVLCRNHNWKAWRLHLREKWVFTPRAIKSRARRQKEKLGAFRAYGGVICSLCGETDADILTIDHVRGGGSRHNREVQELRLTMYEFLRREGYPDKDLYRVLCRNCNWIEGRRNGVTADPDR